MKNKKAILILLMVGLIILALGCNQSEEVLTSDAPVPVEPVDEETEVDSPTLTDTSEKLADPTRTPTSAAEPTRTATSKPASLNPDGPYIIYKGGSGIWISNPDGSFPTQLTSYEPHSSIRHTISPDGDKMALVVRTDEGLDLVIVKIPSGETEIITQLIKWSRQNESEYPTTGMSIALYAIRDYPAIAWQPDGNLLAFMGAINGPTSDLYTYDTLTDEIIQLTDGSAQGIIPIWSPDGKYILHFGVSWKPPFGGAIGGANNIIGAWSARIEDREIIPMPKPEWPGSNFIGWRDEFTYYASGTDEESGGNLLYVDIGSGINEVVGDFVFYHGIKMSPFNQSFIFSNSASDNSELGEGIFMLLPGEREPVKLDNKHAYEFHWLPESNVFWAYPEALFSPTGTTRYDPPVYDKSFSPAISKKGYQAWKIIENQQARVEVKIPGGNWQIILEEKIDDLIWDPVNGTKLIITLRDGSVYSAVHPDYIPEYMGTIESTTYEVFWLP